MEQSQALQELLSLLENVSKICSWKTDEHTKALWFDAVLQKYQVVAAERKQAGK